MNRGRAEDGAGGSSPTFTAVRRPRRALLLLSLGVFALSLGLHLAHLHGMEGSVFSEELLLDSANYHRMAQQILRGEETIDGVLTYNPLYPGILSALYRILGEPDVGAVRLVQAAVGALNCVLVLLLGARFLGPRAGVLAAVAAALYAPLLFFDGLLIQTPWVLSFLLIAFLLAPLSAERRGARGAALTLLAGLFFGAGLLGRPNLLPFLLVFPAWLLLRPGTRSRRGAVLAGALFVLGSAAVIAPVTARNWIKGGELVLVTAHGGINFYIGNNPQAHGWWMNPPGFAGDQEGLIRSARRLAQRETGREMSHGEVSSHWFDKGVDHLLGDPAAGAALWARKLGLFWHAYEMPLAENILLFEGISPVLRRMPLGFGVVAPFALLGLVLALRRFRSEAGILALFVLLYMATLVAFFVTARYRMVVVPFLLVLGAHGALWCFDRVRRRQWKALAPALALLVLVALFSNGPVLGTAERRRADLAYSHFNAANLEIQAGDLRGALERIESAIEIDPDIPQFHDVRAAVLGRLGRHRERLEVAETFCRGWPGIGEAHLALALACHGLALEGEGDAPALLERAEREYLAGLELEPGLLAACQGLAEIYRRSGRGKEAEAMDRRAAAIEERRRSRESSGVRWE